MSLRSLLLDVKKSNTFGYVEVKFKYNTYLYTEKIIYLLLVIQIFLKYKIYVLKLNTKSPAFKRILPSGSTQHWFKFQT